MSLPIDTTPVSKLKTLRDFDEYVTAPLHGFKDAVDYYARCSSKFFLNTIKTETLIVNALNDPLLTKECLDTTLTENLTHTTMELVSKGGHVGFAQFDDDGYYWSERRAVSFITGEG